MNTIRWSSFTSKRPYLFVLLLLVVTVVMNFIFQPGLFERGTLNGNMRVFLPSIFLAAGQAVVLLAGGIDISVGSIVSIVNTILATQLGADASPEKTALWLVIVLFVGMAAGAAQCGGHRKPVDLLALLLTSLAHESPFRG